MSTICRCAGSRASSRARASISRGAHCVAGWPTCRRRSRRLKGEPRRAIVPLAAATTLNEQVRAPSLLAEAFLALGQHVEAYEIATMALQRDPATSKHWRLWQRLRRRIDVGRPSNRLHWGRQEDAKRAAPRCPTLRSAQMSWLGQIRGGQRLDSSLWRSPVGARRCGDGDKFRAQSGLGSIPVPASACV